MPPTTSPGSFKNIPPPEEWIRLEPYYHHLLSFPSVNSVGNSGKPWRFQPTRWSHRCQAFNLLVKELLPFSQAKRSELKSPEVFRGFPVVARASAWLLGLGGWKWVGWKKNPWIFEAPGSCWSKAWIYMNLYGRKPGYVWGAFRGCNVGAPYNIWTFLEGIFWIYPPI